MKRLWLLLFTTFNLAWAQNLTLKKNDKTVNIKQNQPVVIVTQNSEVFNGRFQKIEDNSIILASSIIDIDELKEIKLPYSRLQKCIKRLCERRACLWRYNSSFLWTAFT